MSFERVPPGPPFQRLFIAREGGRAFGVRRIKSLGEGAVLQDKEKILKSLGRGERERGEPFAKGFPLSHRFFSPSFPKGVRMAVCYGAWVA